MKKKTVVNIKPKYNFKYFSFVCYMKNCINVAVSKVAASNVAMTLEWEWGQKRETSQMSWNTQVVM